MYPNPCQPFSHMYTCIFLATSIWLTLITTVTWLILITFIRCQEWDLKVFKFSSHRLVWLVIALCCFLNLLKHILAWHIGWSSASDNDFGVRSWNRFDILTTIPQQAQLAQWWGVCKFTAFAIFVIFNELHNYVNTSFAF
jgi:hypothetical protein